MPLHTTYSRASLFAQDTDAHHREHGEPLLLLDHRGGDRGQADRPSDLSGEASLSVAGGRTGDQTSLANACEAARARVDRGSRYESWASARRACRACIGSCMECAARGTLVAARADLCVIPHCGERRSFGRVMRSCLSVGNSRGIPCDHRTKRRLKRSMQRCLCSGD